MWLGKAVLTVIGTSGWAVESDRLLKESLKRLPRVGPVVLGPYLAAGGDGSWAWADAGVAWMDRTPSGDSAEVTAVGSTPGGRRYRRWNSRAMNPCSS